MGGRIFIVVLGVLAALTLTAAAPATRFSSAERSLLGEINRVRAAHHVAPLRLDPTLQRAARAHSRDMLARDYFAHGNFSARMERFGVRGPRVGENLAWSAGANADPRRIVRVWLRSPTHRANLLRPRFRRVGVAALTGTLRGSEVATVVTADFAGG